jgi:glycosyltransferase involved in cell wall biosynthesis
MPRFKEDTNSASFISELAEGLVNAGNEVIVLAPYDTLFKKYKRPFKLVTYKYIWPTSLHISGYSRVFEGDNVMKPQMYIVSTLMSLSALIHLIKTSREYKVDVVSAHWAIPNGFIAYLASLVTHTPYTITIPGSDVYLAGKNSLFKFAMKLATLNASKVISDSAHYLAQLNSLGIYPKETSVIRYGVNTKLLKPEEKDMSILPEMKISKNKKIIVCLGRFVEKKGFIYVLQAMPQIIKEIPNAVLVMVGGGELLDLYKENIKKMKLERSVFLPGYIPYQMRSKCYNLADVFVMPSIRDRKGNIDASPVAMMDAMACGVPVVATKYSGSSDLVIEGKTGFIVKEKNSSEIANAVIRLLKNPRKKERAKNVRKVAISNFSLEKTAINYTQVFQEL